MQYCGTESREMLPNPTDSIPRMTESHFSGNTFMKKSLFALLLTATLAAHAQSTTPAVAAPNPRTMDSRDQAGMASYDLSGMTGEQKQRMTESVGRNNKQLGHGMAGLGAKTGKHGVKKHKAKRKAQHKHKAKHHRH